jgi:hypothetical protein
MTPQRTQRTHVLRWVAPSLADRSRTEARWELLPIDAYESDQSPREDWTTFWPRNCASTKSGFLALHRWVAERIGWNITLEPCSQSKRTLGQRLLLRRQEAAEDTFFFVWQVQPHE